jgi:hypothetical protein
MHDWELRRTLTTLIHLIESVVMENERASHDAKIERLRAGHARYRTQDSPPTPGG